MRDKLAVVRALEEVGRLLELRGGKDVFRARAYRRAARSLAAVPDEHVMTCLSPVSFCTRSISAVVCGPFQ